MGAHHASHRGSALVRERRKEFVERNGDGGRDLAGVDPLDEMLPQLQGCLALLAPSLLDHDANLIGELRTRLAQEVGVALAWRRNI